jgi:nucleotide-binding universal stress UspA family protein
VYSKVLVPLDGSTVAEQALPFARLLAGAFQIPVELMSVIDTAALAPQVSPDRARYIDTLAAEGMRRSQEYLKGIARKFAGLSVQFSVERGKTETAIIEKAATNKTTMIAMATHGRSGIKRWLLGSIAEKVLRGCSNPLLLVRASEQAKSEEKATLNSIIVPLDGSQLAEKILPHVIALAKRVALEVVLLRAYSLTQIISTYEDNIPDWDTLEAESKGEAISYLDRKARELKGAGLASVLPLISEGEAAEKIIDSAKTTAHSLVAMCTHGRSGIKGWVLGSVTEKVVRHSGDPVLIIRAA